jgi:hypothetical protein
MLETDLPAEEKVGPPGGIPGHDHVVGGVKGGVGHHPVANLEARSLQPPGGRQDSDPHHHHVGRQGGTVGENDGRHPSPRSLGADLVHLSPDPDRHIVVGMQSTADQSHLLAEDPPKGDREGLHHGDLRTQISTCSRYLRPDEPGSDHDHSDANFDLLGQGKGVVEGPKGVNTHHLIGAGKRTGMGPGGDNEGIEGQTALVVENEDVSLDVQGHRSTPEP